MPADRNKWNASTFFPLGSSLFVVFFFLFFPKGKHIYASSLYIQIVSAPSPSRNLQIFLSAYVVTIIIVSYIEAMILILSLSCSKTAKKLTRNDQGRGLNGCEQGRCTSGYTVGYVVEF